MRRLSRKALLLCASSLLGCSAAHPKVDTGEPRDSTDTSQPDTGSHKDTIKTDDTQETDDTNIIDTVGDTDGDPLDPALEKALSVLVINEFMADNEHSIYDDRGLYADWIELFNPGETPLALEGCSLSERLDEPGDTPLDDTLELEPGGFLLFWADNELEAGSQHLDFAISPKAGELGLWNPAGRAIDLLRYGQQESDMSAARVPDGSKTWEFVFRGTPGESND